MPARISNVKRNKRGFILCKHSIVKYSCKICSPYNFCKHGVNKRQCVPCEGAAVCEHGKLKYNCRECHGGNICYHNKLRSKCADCTPKGVYVSYKNGAKKRGVHFPLTLEEYLTISILPCYYCGSSKVRNGIDRKDNSIGYMVENSVSCCSKCNLMKRDYSVRAFLGHVKQIYKFQN
jgi:hypothetical protein